MKATLLIALLLWGGAAQATAWPGRAPIETDVARTSVPRATAREREHARTVMVWLTQRHYGPAMSDERDRTLRRQWLTTLDPHHQWWTQRDVERLSRRPTERQGEARWVRSVLADRAMRVMQRRRWLDRRWARAWTAAAPEKVSPQTWAVDRQDLDARWRDATALAVDAHGLNAPAWWAQRLDGTAAPGRTQALERWLTLRSAAADPHTVYVPAATADAARERLTPTRVAPTTLQQAVFTTTEGVRVGWLGVPLLYRTAHGGVGEDVRSALMAWQTAGSVDVVVLDLRSNPGGLLSQALVVVGAVSGSRPAFASRPAEGPVRVWRSSGPSAWDGPLLVWVDGRTASAAELIAGVLQDQGRARIVGARTYGKGTAQVLVDLPALTPNRPERARLQVSAWGLLRPSGLSTQSGGVAPDRWAPACIYEGERRFTSALTVGEGEALEPLAPARDALMLQEPAPTSPTCGEPDDRAAPEAIVPWAQAWLEASGVP